MSTNSDIVQKLWRLCDVLRDDGITYQQYVTELTLLLFLKMAKETETEARIPEEYRWDVLLLKSEPERLKFYRKMLVDLGSAKDPLVRGIYAGAGTALREPRILEKLMRDLDGLDWYSARADGLGDLYEGLLEKNANESKSGAGQYFTPRELIESMVALVDPSAGEEVQDPAAGTGGFLIAAYLHVWRSTNEHFDLTDKQGDFQRQQAITGVELVPDTRRLALMNLMLHGIEGPPSSDGAVKLGDTLGPFGATLPKVDIILANPPFGTKKGGGGPTREDFTFPTSNKQLAFLQHMYRSLKPGGRAAVVLPDNVLFEEGMGRDIRRDFLDKCDVHTILRLPTGIFYAGGVKTNVLFFSRGKTDKGNTSAVWVYDARTNMPSFGKRTPFLRSEHLGRFEAVYGGDRLGRGPRVDQGESGRWRRFGREEIEKRNWNLDISWLRDLEGAAEEEVGDPEAIANEIMVELRTAMEQMEELVGLLGDAR